MTSPFKIEKKEGWHVSKSYPHFDLPSSFENAKAHVTNPLKVARHDFYPFVAYQKVTRRYKGKEKGASNKARPIKYASHLDGNIYSYYAYRLGNKYEERIARLGLTDVVIGYRSGKGSNRELSHDAIEQIKTRGNCTAIAIDISDFFGNIDHGQLEREWCDTLGATSLPKDHLAVYKSLTNWTCVDREKLVTLLGHNPSKLPKRLVADASQLRALRRADKTLPPEERIFQRNIDAEGKLKTYGIPQGSPMSSLLSNIAMIPFDLEMKTLALETGGFYRRYSDDILFICNTEHVSVFFDRMSDALTRAGSKLKRNASKDHISNFLVDPATHKQTCDKEFQYLGFTFNGRKLLIRSQTLSKYHRRIKFATRSAKKAAQASLKNGGTGKIFRKTLNQDLTHLGKKGFAGSYARKAAKIMGSKAISNQMKGSHERVTRELEKPLYKPKRQRERKENVI